MLIILFPCSPFFHMSAKEIYKKHYEIIVVLEAIVEPTGNSIQARSSYLGDEILWGFRFKNVLEFKNGSYQIDYSSFNKVEKVDTPIYSAKHHEELRKSKSQCQEDHNIQNSTGQSEKHFPLPVEKQKSGEMSYSSSKNSIIEVTAPITASNLNNKSKVESTIVTHRNT